MKKISIYFFIFILIIGIFSPLLSLKAQTPIDYTRPKEIWGTCIISYTINGGLKQTDKRPYVWQGECENAKRTLLSIGHTVNSYSFIPAEYGYCIATNPKLILYPQSIKYICENDKKGIFKSGIMPTGDLIYCLYKQKVYTLNKSICQTIGGKNYVPPIQPATTQEPPITNTCNPTWENLAQRTGVSVADLRAANPTQGDCPSGKVFVPTTNPNQTPNTLPPITPQEPLKDPSYHLLEPIPGCTEGDKGCVCTGDEPNKICKLETFDPTGEAKLGKYLNIIIKLIIGLCAVAAVVMIVVGGVEYTASELISGKEAAKDRIRNAILGLILALGSYAILFTINPDLLITDVGITPVTLDVTLQEFKPLIVIDNTGKLTSGAGGPIDQTSVGTNCDVRKILSAAEASGQIITNEQANTMSCIGRAESSGCKPINANVPGVNSSAFGAWQIVLTLHYKIFDATPICQIAAGVPVGTPLNCRSKSQLCYKAASKFECNAAVALKLMKNQPNFRDWLQTQAPCPNTRCVKKFSPNTNLHIGLGPIPGRGAISDLASYCNIN
jgi:hypothetical protein